MFQWTHEFTSEVNAPLKKTWDFFNNLNNWTKWLDMFESFHCSEELQNGSIIKGKFKNKNSFMSLIVSDVIPYSQAKLTINTLLWSQESITNYYEIHSNKARITTKTTVNSFLVPFCKSRMLKNTEVQFSAMSKAFTEIEEYTE